MWLIAYATAATPTLFAPCLIGEQCSPPLSPPPGLIGHHLLSLHDQIGNGQHVDGGMLVNNPAVMAIREAEAQWPDRKLVVISIGAGKPSAAG